MHVTLGQSYILEQEGAVIKVRLFFGMSFFSVIILGISYLIAQRVYRHEQIVVVPRRWTFKDFFNWVAIGTTFLEFFSMASLSFGTPKIKWENAEWFRAIARSPQPRIVHTLNSWYDCPFRVSVSRCQVFFMQNVQLKRRFLASLVFIA